jgi:peptidyl-prolyl cis-trans isomerase SurA
MDENVPNNVLQSMFREVIQDMVDEQLLLVKAVQDSVQVDMRQVDSMEKEELTTIKKQYNTEEEFKKALEEVGLTDQQFRYMLQEKMQRTLLQQTLLQQISRNIMPTSQDKEAWIEVHKDSLPEIQEQFKLSHILIYPKVSEARKQMVREKLQGILKRIQDGEDFATLAREYSQDPGTASDGGDLGFFSRNEMNAEFSKVAFSLHKGQVSDIVETELATKDGVQFGFHLIKIEEIKGDRINARHILMLLKPNEEDAKPIIEQLKQVREDIVSGKADFGDMAKKYSEDENSRDLGGKLQWLPQEKIIKSFLEQVAKLKKSEISEPFKSQYGFHILRLDDYKPAHKMGIVDDNQLVTQLVTQEKNYQELERILNKLKEETYIDIRLE